MRVDGSDNQPWEELPDERVVIEIKGNKISSVCFRDVFAIQGNEFSGCG
jgi:hypothetical protein